MLLYGNLGGRSFSKSVVYLREIVLDLLLTMWNDSGDKGRGLRCSRHLSPIIAFPVYRCPGDSVGATLLIVIGVRRYGAENHSSRSRHVGLYSAVRSRTSARSVVDFIQRVIDQHGLFLSRKICPYVSGCIVSDRNGSLSCSSQFP